MRASQAAAEFAVPQHLSPVSLVLKGRTLGPEWLSGLPQILQVTSDPDWTNSSQQATSAVASAKWGEDDSFPGQCKPWCLLRMALGSAVVVLPLASHFSGPEGRARIHPCVGRLRSVSTQHAWMPGPCLCSLWLEAYYPVFWQSGPFLSLLLGIGCAWVLSVFL